MSSRVVIGVGIALAVAAAVGFWHHNASAQAPSGPASKIGVVEMVRVFNECDQWKAINAQLQQQGEAHQREVSKRQEEIAAKKAELAAYHPDTPEWTKCNEEVMKLQISAQVWAGLEKNRFETLKKMWVEKNYEHVTSAVAAEAKARGLELVIVRDEIEPDTDDSSRMFAQIINRKVVYYDPRLDITDAVLARLNEAFKLRGGIDNLLLN
jgi:Skp family chaperone for outer membrane proteins